MGFSVSTQNAKFMSPRLGKERGGVCHRCGWSGPVTRIGRADRRRMRTGRAFGRLCSDCVDDLLDIGSAGADEIPRRSGLLRRRDVA